MRADKAIQELAHHTLQLVEFEKLAADVCGDTVVHAVEGECRMFGLLARPDVSVADVVGKKGTLIQAHTHGEVEHILLYEGAMEIEIKGGNRIMQVGDALSIRPDTPHAAHLLEDCRMVCVTVPRSKGYPDVQRPE